MPRFRTLPLTLLGATLAAQATPDDTAKELLELLNTPVTVASAKATSLRESPGVISFITREDILASGARDLVDVLRLVPGFDFGYDGQGVVGLAARGLWAYEGKALVLWDGMEVPELLYGNTPFGHRFPMDQIKRIEIIRGPGSAIYGGLAELAVIKIVTLGAEDLKGPAVGLMAGSSKGLTRSGLSAMTAGKGDGVQWTVGAALLGGKTGTETFPIYGGDLTDLEQRSQVDNRLLHFGVQAGELSARGLFEEYLLENPDTSSGDSQRTRFTSAGLEVRYTWSPAEGVKLTPYVSHRRVTPWVLEGAGQDKRRTVVRLKYGAVLGWDLSKAFNLTLGAEHLTDDATVGRFARDGENPIGLTADGKTAVSYDSTAAYFEAAYTGPVNVTVGGRYEKHNLAGSAFVPRVALTKVFGRWHMKVLFANAFRTPNVLNLGRPGAGATTIDSEKTRTSEVEIGAQMGSGFLIFNVFDTRLSKPLVWNSGYVNGPDTGSKGFEVEYRARPSWGALTLSYAYHKADNKVFDWSVPGQDDRFLGLSNHKLAGMTSFKLPGGWQLAPSFTWLSDRYGYTWSPAAKDMALSKLDGALLLNANASFTRDAWSVSLGVHDLLDKKPAIPQAYPGGGSPLPAKGREVVAQFRWGF